MPFAVLDENGKAPPRRRVTARTKKLPPYYQKMGTARNRYKRDRFYYLTIKFLDNSHMLRYNELAKWATTGAGPVAEKELQYINLWCDEFNSKYSIVEVPEQAKKIEA